MTWTQFPLLIDKTRCRRTFHFSSTKNAEHETSFGNGKCHRCHWQVTYGLATHVPHEKTVRRVTRSVSLRRRRFRHHFYFICQLVWTRARKPRQRCRMFTSIRLTAALPDLSQTASYCRPCTAGSCGFAPVPHAEKGPSRQVEYLSNGVTFPRYGLHLSSLRAEMGGKAWARQVTDWPSDVTSGCL